jgi:hypothetical protein
MDSNHVKIKLQNYLDDLVFEDDNYQIVIKGLVFSNEYTVTSSSTTKLNVNVPPQDCSVFLTPDKGVEFQDKFMI